MSDRGGLGRHVEDSLVGVAVQCALPRNNEFLRGPLSQFPKPVGCYAADVPEPWQSPDARGSSTLLCSLRTPMTRPTHSLQWTSNHPSLHSACRIDFSTKIGTPELELTLLTTEASGRCRSMMDGQRTK